MKSVFLARRVAILLGLGLVVYLCSYAGLRQISIETWKKDGRDYVIFPKEPILIYYAYRPLAVIDGKLTGMRFHIGPHAD